MFINHTKKYIFLGVCKTGSTSIQSTLIENKGDDEVAHTLVFTKEKLYESLGIPEYYKYKNHLTLPEALSCNLLTPEQVQEYRIFGVLRDPIDRFISTAYYFLSMIHNEGSDYDQNKAVMTWFKKRYKEHETINIPDNRRQSKYQVDWLLFDGKPINNIVLYEDVHDIIYKITGKNIELPNHLGDYRKQRNTQMIYEYLKQDIIKEFKDDYDLYMKIKNNLE